MTLTNAKESPSERHTSKTADMTHRGRKPRKSKMEKDLESEAGERPPKAQEAARGMGWPRANAPRKS